MCAVGAEARESGGMFQSCDENALAPPTRSREWRDPRMTHALFIHNITR